MPRNQSPRSGAAPAGTPASEDQEWDVDEPIDATGSAYGQVRPSPAGSSQSYSDGGAMTSSGGAQDWGSDFRQDEYEGFSPDGDASDQPGGMSDQARNAAEQARQKSSEIAGQARDKATEMAGKAQDKASQATEQVSRMAAGSGEQIDEMTDKAGDAATNLARKLREQGGQDGPKAEVAGKVADTMDQAGSYLREHQPSEMWDDVELWVRDHPSQALFGALAAGFVLGRAMR